MLCSGEGKPFAGLCVAGRAIPRWHRAGLRDPRSLCPVPPHPYCHWGPYCHRGAASALGQGAFQPQPPGGQSDPDKNTPRLGGLSKAHRTGIILSLDLFKT